MVGTRYVMSCTLLLLGMYVADCAVCRSHTRTQGGRGVYVFKFPTKPSNSTNTVSLFLFLSVCLFIVGLGFSCCTYVVVYFKHRKGKPGRVSKGGKGRGK